MSPSSGLRVQTTGERARKEGNSSHSCPSVPSSSGSNHWRKEHNQEVGPGHTKTKETLFLSWQPYSCPRLRAQGCPCYTRRGRGPTSGLWLVCPCVLSCGKPGSFSFKQAAVLPSHKAMPPQLPTQR